MLLAIGSPVVIAVGVSSFLYMYLTGAVLETMPQRMFTTIDSSTLFAVPLYLLAGFLMNTAGITNRIFAFADVLVSHIAGGLAHVNVVASTIFASMSGSSVADAAGLGAVEIKAMENAGYDTDFSAAVTLASCTISPIIPPSIIMVIYGVTAEVSIGQLFLAGIIPGLFMALSLMSVNFVISRKRKYSVRPKPTLQEIWSSFREALLPLGTPFIIVGGIIGGVFTPTEAAAVAVAYTLFLDVIFYRELSLRKIKKILLDVGITSSAILFLVSVTGILSWVLAIEQIPIQVMQFFLSITSNPYFIILVINIIILLLGTILDATPIILLMVPILLPLLKSIHFDPIQFGIIISINTMIGLTTPPVGVSLYSVSAVSGAPVQNIVREIRPYWLALIICLLIFTYIPAISLTLPRLIFGQ
jgi:tripartite ATP-independent transporter DctM subunit